MGRLLLILFIVFVIIPVVRLLWTVYKARRQARDFFNNYQRQAGEAYARQYGGGDSDSYDRGRYSEPRRYRRRSGKKIGRDVGEYVSFEELPPQTDRCYVPPRHVAAEDQITDVEWEDVS